MKVGKSWDILKRMNDYMLNFPFINPGLKTYCFLLFLHPTTKAERANIDNCEKWVLARLKTQFPAQWRWPGLLEQSRMYPSRSEWIRWILKDYVAITFTDARNSGLFGKCLFVHDDENTNIPAQWDTFRKGLVATKND